MDIAIISSVLFSIFSILRTCQLDPQFFTIQKSCNFTVKKKCEYSNYIIDSIDNTNFHEDFKFSQLTNALHLYNFKKLTVLL